jgi:hypothetical protein
MNKNYILLLLTPATCYMYYQKLKLAFQLIKMRIHFKKIVLNYIFSAFWKLCKTAHMLKDIDCKVMAEHD